MNNCNTHNCQNLDTRCSDCGRLVKMAQLENQMIRALIYSTLSYPDLDDPIVIAFDKVGKGYSAKDIAQLDVEVTQEYLDEVLRFKGKVNLSYFTYFIPKPPKDQ